jgi:hypothetical protein
VMRTLETEFQEPSDQCPCVANKRASRAKAHVHFEASVARDPEGTPPCPFKAML